MTSHTGPAESDLISPRATLPVVPTVTNRVSVPSLSPSRANDFAQCPLLFRFRVIDRLPEPPSAAAARGTLVHSVLEKIFDHPAADRNIDTAVAEVPAAWNTMVEARPELASLVPQGEDDAWLTQATALLRTYFQLEDPHRLDPRHRELKVEFQMPDGPLLRGIIDRVDVAGDGATRIVDYKTGKSPRPGYGDSAAFQMRFYALLLWRTEKVIPTALQLIYLGDGQILRNSPTAAELAETEERIAHTWNTITESAKTGRWRPRKSPLCGWCAHQAYCPEFGGTPPELDPQDVERATGVAA